MVILWSFEDVQGSKKFESPNTYPPDEVERVMLCLLVSVLILSTNVLSLVYLGLQVLFVHAFHSLKWPSSVVLKCCLVFLCERNL